jgi:hypothetical protein
MSIADLLVPNPYPINVGAISSPNITTGALTVTNAIGTGAVNIVTALTNPIQVNATAPTLGNDITFYNAGVRTASYGIDTVNGTFYVRGYSPANADLQISTGGTERITVGAGGITDNENATKALVQTFPGGTVVWHRTLDGGAYSPSFGNLGGFGTLSGTAGRWSRNGDTVTVTIILLALQASAGVNQAAISLPVVPGLAFTQPTDLVGPASYPSSTVANAATISARVGDTRALLVVDASAGATADLTASFIYEAA